MKSKARDSEEKPSMDTMLNMMLAAGGRPSWDFEHGAWRISIELENRDTLMYRGFVGQALEDLVTKAWNDYLRGMFTVNNVSHRFGHGWIDPRGAFGSAGA